MTNQYFFKYNLVAEKIGPMLGLFMPSLNQSKISWLSYKLLKIRAYNRNAYRPLIIAALVGTAIIKPTYFPFDQYLQNALEIILFTSACTLN